MQLIHDQRMVVLLVGAKLFLFHISIDERSSQANSLQAPYQLVAWLARLLVNRYTKEA